MLNDKHLEPEDYIDPACPFCTEQYEKEPPVRRIPEDRVLAKLDALLSRRDYSGAERLLGSWLAEAVEGRDLRGEFLLRNERLGLFRKLGRREETLGEADAVLALVEKLGIGDTVGAATAYVNAGTAKKAFGLASDALPLFESARRIFESVPRPDPFRLGSFYNNYALALSDCGRYGEARRLFSLALDVMGTLEGSEPERAVTWLNLADLAAAEAGMTGEAERTDEAAEREIEDCLGRAEELLDTPGLARDGNYAFVCEKCAPVFDWYGWFLYAKELRRRSEEIYGR